MISPQSEFPRKSVPAFTHLNSKEIHITSKLAVQTISGENQATISHEFGHTAGLYDVNLSNALIIEDKNHNLMTQAIALSKAGVSRNEATTIESTQIQTIINNRQINRSMSPFKFASIMIKFSISSLFRR